MQVVKESHTKQILRLLQTNHQVSNFAMYKITPRYSARIHELRNDGYEIERTRDRGNLFNKPRPNMYWFRLEARFEVNSRD